MKLLKHTLLLLLLALTPSFSLAQDDFNADAYDPFADYSEFDQASEEEADINFFRNGRFFTLGFIGGYRMYTSILGEILKPAPAFGGYISYFFDLRFAIQLTYITGAHQYSIRSGTVNSSGTNSTDEIGFGIKYFLNTQNVTKGLAPINPYILLGIAQIYRTTRLDGTIGLVRDGAMGFNASFGLEIPMMRNKMYFGAEATYQYVNFPDENNQIPNTGIFPRGDVVRFSGLIGINF